MDTGLNVRQVQPTTGVAVRTDVVGQRPAARTELPTEQVVAPAAEVQPVRFDQNDEQKTLRAQLNRAIDAFEGRPTIKVEQDETTRELVFRKLSPSTGQVVQQFPDEAVMRQRIYAAQQRRAELDQALMTPAPEDHVYKVA